MTCRHPKARRVNLSSTSVRCDACGLVNAMVAGRSGVSRRWLPLDDPRVAEGRAVTVALLESAREAVKPEPAKLSDWAIEFGGPDDGYTAPEIRGIRLVGIVTGHHRKEDGKQVATSTVARVEGRRVWTRSGTEYELVGDPCIEYRTWLLERGKPYDVENPIKVIGGGK